MRIHLFIFSVWFLFLGSHWLHAQESVQEAKRRPHPLAPSLPTLTEEEKARARKIVNDFILYDIGQLQGTAGKKALEDFQELGPETIFILIEGLNETANLQSSCPAVIIGRKIATILNSTKDKDLLAFARENMGAGVTVKRHMGVIQDLKLACILRTSYLQRNKIAATRYGEKEPRLMSLTELVKAGDGEKGIRLEQLLTEIETRTGDEVVVALGSSMNHKDKKIQALAQNLLLKHLVRQPEKELRNLLRHDLPEVRGGTSFIIGYRGLPWGQELIRMLDDYSPLVQQGARQALVRLSRGQDFGPLPGSSDSERQLAIRNWENWWKQQSSQ